MASSQDDEGEGGAWAEGEALVEGEGDDAVVDSSASVMDSTLNAIFSLPAAADGGDNNDPVPPPPV